MSVARPLCSCHCFFCAEKRDVSPFAPCTQRARHPPLLPLKDTYWSQENIRMLILSKITYKTTLTLGYTDIPGAYCAEQMKTGRDYLYTVC